MHQTVPVNQLDGSILKDLQQQVPEGLPALAEAVNHLQPLKLPPQFMWNVNGTRLGVTAGPEAYVLRASRMRLRKWLATEITITYGKQAVDIEQTEESVTVQFQDGTSAHGDILVGADGINSHSMPIDQLFAT